MSLTFQPKNKIGPGEYNNWAIGPDGNLYDLAAPKPVLISSPSSPWDVRGCLHHQAYIDKAANLYVWGKSAAGETGAATTTTTTPQLVSKDIKGNPFGLVLQVEPYCNAIGGNGYLILKGDGTVWIMGNTQTGMKGDGTAGDANTIAPTQVVFPAGVVITKIGAGVCCGALDATGGLWMWGSDVPNQYYKTYTLARGADNPDATKPGKVALPWAATDICVGGFFNYAVSASGSLAGWGYYPDYLTGVKGAVKAGNTPVVLDSLLKLPAPVAKVFMSVIATYVILTTGKLWAWGDNAVGACGNGVELNFATYKTPYAWDWGLMELPQAPVAIMPTKTFNWVFASLGDAFYYLAEDTDGNLYSAGRNKGFVLANGLGSTDSNLQSAKPNLWDVPLLTAINPFGNIVVAPPVVVPPVVKTIDHIDVYYTDGTKDTLPSKTT